MKKRMLSVLLVGLFLLEAAGCSNGSAGFAGTASDLMTGVLARKPEEVLQKPDTALENITAVTDFGIRLLKKSLTDEENTLISPLSVLYALGMTANGAKGNTLSQFEEAFGLPVSALNDCLYSYRTALPETDKCRFNIANSIWFRDDSDRLTVRQEFLQTNADYYAADLFKAPFDDTTLKEINDWVKKSTNDMIPEILDTIPDDAVMYLINAIAFEAEWEEIYYQYDVYQGVFTKEDGSTDSVDFMNSHESRYIEDDSATGFFKYYKNRDYAFVALLPKEGIRISDYISSLNGEYIASLLANTTYESVSATIPKFTVRCSTDIANVLQALGITDAFMAQKADFSALGTSKNGNIFISRVLHDTFLSVDEKGTKAGAATLVEATDGAAFLDTKRVLLNRPFLYMLVDCKHNVPIFIGTVMEIK